MHEYSFRLKARQDSYNGTTRIRYQTSAIYDIDFIAESDYLIEELQSIL